MIIQTLPDISNYKASIIQQDLKSQNHTISSLNDYEVVRGNMIHPTAIINWSEITIGNGNIIGPFVCIGTEPQHKKLTSNGKISIGNDNVFREYSTVHLPTSLDSETKIGNRNYFMVNAHVAHDCTLEDNIVMCNNASLAGHVHIMHGASLALNCSIHQFQVIGSWSMVGMNSCVSKSSKISPGRIFFGVPAKYIGRNRIALERHQVRDDQLVAETERFDALWMKRL